MNAVPSEAGAASPSGPDSPQSDAVAQRDEAVGFLTGNPSVQQWKGQVHARCVSLPSEGISKSKPEMASIQRAVSSLVIRTLFMPDSALSDALHEP